jgi:hypothetical protein
LERATARAFMTQPAASETLRTLLTPITLRTAGERIAERIVTAVALGEFVPGQRLPRAARPSAKHCTGSKRPGT